LLLVIDQASIWLHRSVSPLLPGGVTGAHRAQSQSGK